jgi:16S rRNA (uracil1498-N3)-methyltransferase
MKFEDFLRWASVSVPTPVAAVESGDHHPLLLVASLHAGTKTLKQALATYAHQHGCCPRSALWLVGPEGDFSPTEMTAAMMAGFVPVTLGPLVLRSDTAAIYALSILSNELGSP